MSGEKKSVPNGNALLSVEEISSLACVSKTTVRRLVKTGEVPAVRINRLVRVRLSDWTAYLEGHRVVGRPLPVPTARPRAAGGRGAPTRSP